MKSAIVAAIFVAKDGPYIGTPGIWPWTEEQDAKKYNGPFPVIAHPPCERWGRYWGGGPSVKIPKKLGDDGGRFASALESVRRFGGVLEHPAHSHAWAHFGLARPPRSGGWVEAGDGQGFVCHVEQGHYGHKARKATWLYAVSDDLPGLKWGESKGMRLDEGFHSAEERRAARAAGIKPIKRLSKKENTHTPMAFLRVLHRIARGAA